MKITWVTRSFLDYRIPVYEELDRLCNHQLTVIYNKEIESDLLIKKIESILGNRAIGMMGEFRLGGQKIENAQFSNSSIRIPYQPGLLKKIKETHPDVMLSDGFMQWTYAPLLYRLFHHDVPHVMCYERTCYTERNCQWYRTLYRKFVLHWIDGLCANGVLCKEYLVQLGAGNKTITLGQMAADTDGVFSAAESFPKEEIYSFRAQYNCRGPLFLYVGQIIPRKGIQQLLLAWKKSGIKDAVLLLVGDGKERANLEKWCKDNTIDNIFWIGKKPYHEIARYYRIADVFIIPTLEDNWSLVVPEAMACGLPIACSIYNGCYPELVHPENGWLFDPYDQEATAEMLNNIVERKNELPLMGQKSREIVANHTPRKAAEAIYKAITSVINNKVNFIR